MPARFTIEETKNSKGLNTPGGEELYKKLGGSGGIPFFAFLDEHGRTIVNTIRMKDGKPAGNIGYPGEPFEIDWFLAMLAKAVPQMTAEESGTIEKWLRANAPKPH